MSSDQADTERFHEGKDNAHNPFDSKDQRSLANRRDEAQQRLKDEDTTTDESAKTITDPLAPAKAHGNKPSRGAEIDAEIQKEEEEYLAKKDGN